MAEGGTCLVGSIEKKVGERWGGRATGGQGSIKGSDGC